MAIARADLVRLRTLTMSRLERIRASPNFRSGRFHNLDPTRVMAPGKAFEAARGWLLNGDRRPPGPLPGVALSREAFADPPADDVRVCWLGHSTVLVELEGARVLFDPMWSNRSSPTQAIGPSRFQPAP